MPTKKLRQIETQYTVGSFLWNMSSILLEGLYMYGVDLLEEVDGIWWMNYFNIDDFVRVPRRGRRALQESTRT